jgi:glycosyltransferase involved in cell wall biosynthesis
VFWLEFLSPHVAELLHGLAAQGTEVVVVVLGSMTPYRLHQGWQPAGPASVAKGIKVIDPAAAQALLQDRAGELIHIIEGLGGNAVVRPHVARLRASGCRWGVMAEVVDRRGIAGALRWLVYIWRFRLAGRRPDFVLAIGADAPAWMRATSGLGRQVYPFAYFLPATHEPVPDSVAADGLPRITYVGQLIRRKRVDLLLQACAIACRGRARLHIVGDGPEKAALQRLAQTLGISDAVTFHGVISLARVRAFLLDADCLVLPSDHDGWGAVVSESLLCGVPTIVSDAVGAREIVQCSGNGGVFAAGNAADLGRLLDRQLGNGRVTSEQRRSLAAWASSSLSGPAGAAYLRGVLAASLEDREPPAPPWVARSAAQARP